MSISEEVYWYNVSANKNGVSPTDKIYSYQIGVKGLRKENHMAMTWIKDFTK